MQTKTYLNVTVKNGRYPSVSAILTIIILMLCGIPGISAALITCPSGYTCLSNSDATARWGQGNFVKYSGDACSVDIDFTVYSYCYAQKTQPSCPSGYDCMPEKDAISRWGQGNYEKYSGTICGSGGVSTPVVTWYYCFKQKPVNPVCTAPACNPGEVLYCPGQCPGGCGLQCTKPTTVIPQCTRPACNPGEVLYCPGQCPGGCGLQCMMPTTPPTVVPNANFVFSGRVYEWRFDPDQDMFGEMPRYIQRVNNEEVLLFGAYSPSGYDVENYIASNWTDWNGDYAISLGLNTPHRNFTYYYLSPSGAFPGGPWQYFNATSSEGKTHASTYGRVIYYSTPLTGKTGKGNDFMLYKRNTSQTTVYPTLVVKNATLVPPMNIVTPTMLVQQSPVNASGGDQEPSSAPSGYFLGVVGIATLAIIGAGVWLARKIPIPSRGTEDLKQYGSQLDDKHRGIPGTEDLNQYGSLQDAKHRGIPGTEDLNQYGSLQDAKHRGITETEDLKQYGSLQDDKHRGI